jgi:hypothetical protein
MFPSRVSLLLSLSLIACSSSAPPWARFDKGQRGDDTITGPPVDVPRASSTLQIDGRLDEAAWARAPRLGPFVDPGQGADVGKHPVAAQARVLWDERKLYVGIVVEDRDPQSTLARDAVDPHIWAEASGIEVMLQPGDPGDNRDYYELQVDVNGAVWDTRFDDYNQPITGVGPERRFGHQEWSSQLERAVHRVRGRLYAVELALPWASLGPARVAVPPRPGDVWRLNLYSFRDGQRRALAWSPLRNRGNFHKSERFGRVRFTD